MRVRSPPRSIEVIAVPPSAATKPSSWTKLTPSPCARPHATGIAAATDAIGATTVIAPAAIPR